MRWSIFLSKVSIPWFFRSQLSKAFPMSAHPSDSVIPTGRELRFSACLRGDPGRKLAQVPSWVVETSTPAIPRLLPETLHPVWANSECTHSSPPPDVSLSGSTFCLIFVPYLCSSWWLCSFLCTNITSVLLLNTGCCQYFAVIDNVLAFYTWQISASGKQILRMGECICNFDIF